MFSVITAENQCMCICTYPKYMYMYMLIFHVQRHYDFQSNEVRILVCRKG